MTETKTKTDRTEYYHNYYMQNKARLTEQHKEYRKKKKEETEALKGEIEALKRELAELLCVPTDFNGDC